MKNNTYNHSGHTNGNGNTGINTNGSCSNNNGNNINGTSKSKKSDPHHYYQPYLLNHVILIMVSLIGMLILFLIGFSYSIPYEGADAPSCRGVYMSPAYAKIHAFDSTHTRFASKYSLYLYREQYKDAIPDDEDQFNLSGTPILFIPGNAGSYKQVRSIAAEAANQFFDNNAYIKSLNLNTNNLDFFTADFNEDFTAFHGKTMLDQAEYLNDAIKFILSLYRLNDDNGSSSKSSNIPNSVILLGHSMGGIVARVMLSLPNYLEQSVNTIVTLSTPHNAAPTTFDGDLLNVFKLTDDFWRNGFVKDENLNTKLSTIARRRLADVSLISITGGILDTTLPTDYTTLTGLVPSNHGLAVSTTGIPGVWTPVDHLAVVWCDQLRKVLAKTLLQIIDVNSPAQTYPLEKRMEIFRSILLPGFQKSAEILKNLNMNYNLPYKLKIDLKQLKDSANQRFIQLPKSFSKRSEINSPPIHLFYVPKDENFKFNFISSLKPSNIENLNESPAPSVLLCRTILKDGKFSNVNHHYKQVHDYTTDVTSQFAELECIDVNQFVYQIPKSDPQYDSNEETDGQYYALEIPSNILASFNSIVLVESSTNIDYSNDHDFVLADLELEKSSFLKLGDSSLWKLITRGNDITIPSHRSIIVDIDIPSISSSLLAYSLDIRYSKSKNEKFSTLISQTVKGETKWHTNIDSNKIITSIINGNSPYTPFIVDDPSSHVKLKIFSDSLSSDQLMDIYLSIDWFQSLKLLVLKYRLSIIGFPLSITLLIISFQFIHYSNYNLYPSFGETMLYICDFKIMSCLALVFSSLSFLTSTSSIFGQLFELLDPVERNDLKLMDKIENREVRINSTFMGIEEPSLWFYGTIILFVSIGLNFLLYNLILLTLRLAVKLSRFRIWKIIKVPKFSYFSTQRKTLSILSLLMLVLIYLPYQFAFVVCVLTQAFSTLNLFISHPNLNSYFTPDVHNMVTSDDSIKENGKNSCNGEKDNVFSHPNNSKDLDKFSYSRKSLILLENFKNFNLSFTILMLWLIPINIPVLIVWIHDISLKWRTPFSSHHNVLAVLPIIILVQMLNQGYMIPRPTKTINIFLTKVFLCHFSIYSLLFGTRHLYFLHSLFNFVCVWFLITMIQDWGNGHLEKVNVFQVTRSHVSKIH